jgi:hypothetical protein
VTLSLPKSLPVRQIQARFLHPSERKMTENRITGFSAPRRARTRKLFVRAAAVAFGLFFGTAVHAASVCDICGAPLTNTFYSVTDKLREEKAMVCAECIKLTAHCFICGLPVKTNFTTLPDGRFICSRDAETAVLDDERAKDICRQTRDEINRLLSRFISLPETNVTTRVVDRVELEGLFKHAGRDNECPNVLGCLETQTNRLWKQHSLSVLSGLPLAELKATCAHEYGHAWLNENLTRKRHEGLGKSANEAFCELLAFKLMDAENEETEKKLIQRNTYTRGQIRLFINAQESYGFNDILDWVRYGTDSELSADEPARVRRVEFPRQTVSASSVLADTTTKSVAEPETLVLKGIFWSPTRPQALINGRTFEVNEEGKVRLGATNVTIRCLAIEERAVRVRIAGSGEERELQIKSR